MARSRPSKTDVQVFREAVCPLVPDDAKYVASTFYFPDEPGENGSSKVDKLKRKGIINRAVSAYAEQGCTTYDELPKNLSEVLAWVSTFYEGDGSWCRCCLMTLKDFKKHEEEKERRACEEMAGMIVDKYKVKPNSMAFIAAVHRHYTRIARAENHFRTDPEMRMERYGCCMANGNTAGFWEDNDYSSAMEHHAYEDQNRLLNYCERYLPLLMARWEERRLRRKNPRT